MHAVLKINMNLDDLEAMEKIPMTVTFSQANVNVFQTLLILLLLTFLMGFIRYHWKRRKLYKMARQRPGPLPLPFIGSALHFFGSASTILKNLTNLVKKYDSPITVWLGSDLYFILSEPKDIEIILNSPHALEKDRVYRYIEIGIFGLFVAPVSIWKRHRKIIAPTFNQKILDGFVDVFSEKSEILSTQLEKEVGKGIFDIHEYVSRCTVDIICDTAMGITTNVQTTESDFPKWVDRGLELAYKRMFNFFYHFDFIFGLTRLSEERYDIIRKINGFTGAVVKEKREAYQRLKKEGKETGEFLDEDQKKRKTFLQTLIELSENGEHFTDEELRDEVNTFMVAGSDTTASVESFAFVVLGLYPHIQQKVYEEIIDVLGPDRPVQAEDLGKFPYMERFLKETLRLFPVSAIFVRAVTKDIKLTKCIAPAGSSIAICTVGAQWDPKIWPEPFKFDPDRFLPEEVAKRHPYSWLPFSQGPRNCIGIKFAYMAMKTTIAAVVRKYSFGTNYKSIEDIELQAGVVLKASHGYRVSMELRT